MSGVTSATAPVILACRLSTFAGRGGKYTSALTEPRKKKSEDRGGLDGGSPGLTHRSGKRVETHARFSMEMKRSAAMLEIYAEVTPDVLRRIWEKIRYRWDICHVASGSHIELRRLYSRQNFVWLHFCVCRFIYHSLINVNRFSKF
jgi:hypothetical protein